MTTAECAVVETCGARVVSTMYRGYHLWLNCPTAAHLERIARVNPALNAPLTAFGGRRLAGAGADERAEQGPRAVGGLDQRYGHQRR